MKKHSTHPNPLSEGEGTESVPELWDDEYRVEFMILKSEFQHNLGLDAVKARQLARLCVEKNMEIDHA